MARAKPSFRDLFREFESIKGKRRLFAFILYDERPSSKIIGNYYLNNLEWLDSLANASQMYVFIYQERIIKRSVRDDNQVVISRNPSLKIARMFNIKANQLPGIVFFTVPEFQDGNGIYLPLKANIFQDENHAEELTSNIFSIVQKCQYESATEELLFKKVSRELGMLVTSEKVKPVGNYLGRNLKAIGNVPISIFDNLGEALGPAILGILIKGTGN